MCIMNTVLGHVHLRFHFGNNVTDFQLLKDVRFKTMDFFLNLIKRFFAN